MSVKGLLSLLFGLLLVVSGIWLTLDQAQQEQQWNLKREAASGVIPGELPGDEVTAGTGTGGQASADDSGIVNMLP